MLKNNENLFLPFPPHLHSNFLVSPKGSPDRPMVAATPTNKKH